MNRTLTEDDLVLINARLMQLEERFEKLNRELVLQVIVKDQSYINSSFIKQINRLQTKIKSLEEMVGQEAALRIGLDDELELACSKKLVEAAHEKYVLLGEKAAYRLLESSPVDTEASLTEEDRISILEERMTLVAKSLDMLNPIFERVVGRLTAAEESNRVLNERLDQLSMLVIKAFVADQPPIPEVPLVNPLVDGSEES